MNVGGDACLRLCYSPDVFCTILVQFLHSVFPLKNPLADASIHLQRLLNWLEGEEKHNARECFEFFVTVKMSDGQLKFVKMSKVFF